MAIKYRTAFKKLVIGEALIAALLFFFCFLKIQMDDEIYYGIFDVENKPESFISDEGVVTVDETHGLKEGDVVCTTPVIHIQKGNYTLEIDHQQEKDSIVQLINKEEVIATYELPADELISNISFSTDFDLYGFSVRFLYPGGVYTFKHMYLRSDRPFYADTVFIYVCVFLLCIGFGIYAYRTRFWEKSDREKLLVFAVIFLAIFINYPLYWMYTKSIGDMSYHLARIENTRNELLAGQFPVNLYFLQNYNRGYLATLYPSFFIYIPAAIRLLGVSTTKAFSFFIVLINTATMATSYMTAKKLTGRRDAALLFMALYTMLPYRVELLWYRNALGELLAMIFLPLLVLALYEMLFGDRRYWLLLVLSMSGFIESHVISVVFAVGVCAAAVLVFIRQLFKEKRFIYFCLAAVATLLLNTGYILPFAYYYTSGLDLDQALAAADFSQGAVFVAQLFMMFAGKGRHSSNPAYMGIYDECSMAFGAAGFVCLCVAIYFSIFKAKKDDRDKFITWLTAMAVLTLFMSTTWFPWGTFQKFEKINDVLKMIQFPTRFRQLAETFAALAGCAALVRYEYFLKHKKALAVGLVVSSAFLAIFTSDAFLSSDENYKDAFGQNIESGNYADYVPEGYRESAFRDEGNTSEAALSDYLVLRDRVTFSYRADKDTYADIKRIYYKGYRAFDENGRELMTSNGDGGRVRIDLPKGEGQVTLVFTAPNFFDIGYIISLITMLGLCMLWAFRGRAGAAAKAIGSENTGDKPPLI